MPQAISQNWTARDLDLLETLALRVRLLSLSQVALGWWGGKQRSQLAGARRRLRRLCDAGLLERYEISAHPILPLHEPVLRWSPGESTPEFEPVAWQLQSRWSEPSQPLSVYIASRVTANFFLSYAGRLPPMLAWTHDLHMGQVYLRYKQSFPEQLADWLGEDAVPKAGWGIKDPDAFLCDERGFPYRVVDFGGRYPASRLKQFHHHCRDRELAYELW